MNVKIFVVYHKIMPIIANDYLIPAFSGAKTASKQTLQELSNMCKFLGGGDIYRLRYL